MLKTEIDTDPLTRNYAGMTDVAVAIDINDPVRTIKRKVPIGEIQAYAIQNDLYSPIKNATGHANPTVKMAAEIFNDLGLMKADEFDFELTKPGETDPQIVRICDALVAGITKFTTTHKTGILALADVTVSRATELGLPTIRAGNVQEARS